MSVSTDEGREISFRVAGPGELVGEIALLDGSPRTADATAIDPTELRSIDRASLDRLIETRPALARALIAMLCTRLRRTSEQLEQVALQPIERRLAAWLVGLARSGRPRPDGRTSVSVTLSQGELALLLGASRPKVNGALSTLEERGLIVRGGHLVHCDLPGLQAMLGDR